MMTLKAFTTGSGGSVCEGGWLEMGLEADALELLSTEREGGEDERDLDKGKIHEHQRQ